VKILVAGIGNIFLGDDGFGCEVVRRLQHEPLLPEAEVIDFGIRSYDLAFALSGTSDAIVLVDALSRGEPPGTTFLLEIDVNQLGQEGRALPDAHRLDAFSALAMAQSWNHIRGRVYLVGCEPAQFGGDTGQIGLSMEVERAVPQAIEMIHSLLDELRATEAPLAGAAPAGKDWL
jgi:hydrogenase maturation protease